MNPDHFTVDPGARALLVDLGIRPANVLRRASLPPDLFSRGPVTLSPDEYFAFWTALDDEAGDPNLPISIGRAISVEVFDPPIFAAMCSPDLNVAAKRIARYKRLMGPIHLGIDTTADGTTIEYHWPDMAAPPDTLVLTELVFWVALARIATRTKVRPLRVTAPTPPSEAAAYGEYLGVAIDAGPQTVTFTPMDARRPFLTADESMWEVFEPELRRRLADMEAESSTGDRTRAALLELLPAGRATMRAVAGELAVSTRTLQRRLKSEDTTFQHVLNETRADLAHHYLTNADVTAGEISFLLGYEDPNSFYRAFHNWTGRTPDQARGLAT